VALPHGSASAGAHPPVDAAGPWQTTPNPINKGDLTSVAALSDQDAYAVGYHLTGNTTADAVALRWDGSAWTQHSVLPPQAFPAVLAVRSDTDIWAAGGRVVHWNGTAWADARPAQDPAGRLRPLAIATSDGGTVWLAGEAVPGSVKKGTPAVQEWDGAKWNRQALPSVGNGELDGIAVLSPTDIWATGLTYASQTAPAATLALHFDGTSGSASTLRTPPATTPGWPA
jgi:hypothetical protein